MRQICTLFSCAISFPIQKHLNENLAGAFLYAVDYHDIHDLSGLLQEIFEHLEEPQALPLATQLFVKILSDLLKQGETSRSNRCKTVRGTVGSWL